MQWNVAAKALPLIGLLISVSSPGEASTLVNKVAHTSDVLEMQL